MKKSSRIIAVSILFFNALGAIFGGVGLILDPTGELMQMPIEFLKDSPFQNYLIPGIILLVVNGFFNGLVGVLGIMKKSLFPILTFLCGLLLVIWLSFQILIIKAFSVPMHTPYYAIGLSLIIFGLVLRKQLKSST